MIKEPVTAGGVIGLVLGFLCVIVFCTVVVVIYYYRVTMIAKLEEEEVMNAMTLNPPPDETERDPIMAQLILESIANWFTKRS